MKVVVRSSSLLLTFVAIISNARMGRVEAALRRGIVGRWRIGMSLEELLEDAEPAIIDCADERSVKVYLDPDKEHPPGLRADLTNGSVSQFEILSEQFRTDIGIGVGTSLEELSRFYEISWHEPDLAYVDSLQMRFGIKDGKVASILVS